MSPVPEAAPQLEPGEAAHVQVIPVSCVEKESATAAPVTSEGPLLVTTIVYVSAAPALIDVLPSVFVIARSELSVIVSLSVALLLVVGLSATPAGAVTVAVLTRLPVADDFTVAETV